MMEENEQRIEIEAASVVELAVEVWRLGRHLGKNGGMSPAVNHFMRRSARFFERCGVETVDLTGCAYAPGMAVEVAGTVRPADGAAGAEDAAPAARIVEMIEPLILRDGRAVRFGSVIVEARAAGAERAEEQ